MRTRITSFLTILAIGFCSVTASAECIDGIYRGSLSSCFGNGDYIEIGITNTIEGLAITNVTIQAQTSCDISSPVDFVKVNDSSKWPIAADGSNTRITLENVKGTSSDIYQIYFDIMCNGDGWVIDVFIKNANCNAPDACVGVALSRQAGSDDPGDPGNPDDPGDPTDPTNPENPGDPTDPTNPENPEGGSDNDINTSNKRAFSGNNINPEAGLVALGAELVPSLLTIDPIFFNDSNVSFNVTVISSNSNPLKNEKGKSDSSNLTVSRVVDGELTQIAFVDKLPLGATEPIKIDLPMSSLFPDPKSRPSAPGDYMLAVQYEYPDQTTDKAKDPTRTLNTSVKYRIEIKSSDSTKASSSSPADQDVIHGGS